MPAKKMTEEEKAARKAKAEARAKVLGAIKLSEVKFSVTAPQPDRVKTHGREPAERSKIQRAVDKLVEQAYDKWVKAGKPEKTSEKPPGHITVANDPETVDAIVAVVRSAGVFTKHRVRFLEPEESEDKTKLDIAFVVSDPLAKETASESEATDDDSDESGKEGDE